MKCLTSLENVGMMVHDAGAGPAPIPQKELNAGNLTDAIKFTLRPEAQAAAKRMGQQIRNEVSAVTLAKGALWILIDDFGLLGWHSEWCIIVL